MTFWEQIQPAVISIAGTIITLVIGIVGAYMRSKLSVETQSILQGIFQKAVENGAGVALNQTKPETVVNEVLKTSDPAVRTGIDYVKKSVPETVKTFGLGDNELGEKIISKMVQIVLSGKPKE